MTEAEFAVVIREYHNLSEAQFFRKLNDKELAKLAEYEAKLEALAELN